MIAASLLLTASLAAENGTFPLRPEAQESEIPAAYRIRQCDLPFQCSRRFELPNAGVEVYDLTFPSLVESPHSENNTVHAEFYRPKGDGPFPAVIILDVLAGDQSLSRGIGLFFAQQGIAGLFVQMAYYGPRRPEEGRVRLLSPDVGHTIAGIQQSVVDCRCAAAWLASRPDVDADRLGIIGTSLGSFIAALTGAMEPRLERVVLLLGGGGLADAYYDHPRAGPFRRFNELLGGSKERIARIVEPVDPLTYAERLKGKDVLMVAAARDTIVPATAARALWEATGRPKIVWLDTDHYGAVFYLFPVMRQALDHFLQSDHP